MHDKQCRKANTKHVEKTNKLAIKICWYSKTY